MKKKSDKIRHYINNKDFVKALVEYKEICSRVNRQKPRPSDYIGKCIMQICQKLSYKSNFGQYTYRDEMEMDAIESCVHAIGNFDINKTENAFGYFTMVAWTAMVRRILAEKKQNAIKHKNYQHQYRSSELEGELGLDQSNNEYSNRIIEEFEAKLNKPLTKVTKKVKIVKIKEKK